MVDPSDSLLAPFASPSPLSTVAGAPSPLAAAGGAPCAPSARPGSQKREEEPSDDRPVIPPPVWVVASSKPRASATPCLRAGHSLAALSNRIYLFGGYCDYASYVASSPPDLDQLLTGARPGIGIHFNSLHEYATDSAEWTVLHPGCHPHEARGQALPKPRRHASMVVHGGSLFVYGGFDVDDHVLPDLWQFRIDTAMWIHIPMPVPSTPSFAFQHEPLAARRSQVPVARAEHTAVVDANCMIVFGGYDGKKKLNDTFVFDFARRQWFRPQNAEHNAPSRRCKHSAVLYKRCMYVVGGFQFHAGDNYAQTDLHVLDLDTYTWSELPMGTSSPDALQGHKAVVCGDSMYFVGGKVRARSRHSLSSGCHSPAVAAAVAAAAAAAAGMGNGAAQGHMHVLPSGGEISIANTALIGMPQLPPSSFADSPGHLAMDMGVAATAAAVAAGAGVGGPNGAASLGGVATLGGTPANLVGAAAFAAAYANQNDSRSSGLNSTVFQYAFETNRWSAVDTSGSAPTPRQLHAAVSLPSEGGRMSIFVFGGTDRSKQCFFHHLHELRGIRTNLEVYRHPCESCSGTKSLLNNAMFSDVKFVVEGREIHAHRCILYSRAEYFRNMFDSKMRETSEKEIVIPDVPYEVFMAVLEYLYSGTVRVSSGKLSVELLKAADMFRIEGLRNLCVEKVEQAVTVENAAFICQVADMHNATNLKQYCITFMMHNFRDIISSQSFQNLMRHDPGGLGKEVLEAYSDNSPYTTGAKRPRK